MQKKDFGKLQCRLFDRSLLIEQNLASEKKKIPPCFESRYVALFINAQLQVDVVLTDLGKLQYRLSTWG